MITAVTTVLGFLGAFIPELLKLWKARQDHQQEMDKMRLQMEAQKELAGQRIEEINVQADVDEQRLALEASKPQVMTYTGSRWLDVPIVLANVLIMVVNGLVRPTITYAYFWLYAAVKWAQYQVFSKTLATPDAILVLWQAEDQAVFGAVIGFWFGSRTLKWMKERYR